MFDFHLLSISYPFPYKEISKFTIEYVEPRGTNMWSHICNHGFTQIYTRRARDEYVTSLMHLNNVHQKCRK